MCSNAKESGYLKGLYCLPFGEAGRGEKSICFVEWGSVSDSRDKRTSVHIVMNPDIFLSACVITVVFFLTVLANFPVSTLLYRLFPPL